MTGGMMGRTSDTRIYNPRSESSEMFRGNHEDERPPSGIEDGQAKESRKDKRQDKREAEEEEDKKIRHIKVRSHHLGLGGSKSTESIDEEDDSGKAEAEKEIHNQTMPSGAGGFMTSLAMGAKGPGAAGGEMIQMSEPMRMANQLLKAPPVTTLYSCGECKNIYDNEQYANECCMESPSFRDFEEKVGWHGKKESEEADWEKEYREMHTPEDWEKHKGEPMDIAFQLLKSDRSVARRRKAENYAKWTPSTGQFERPKGGGDPRNATSRRAKNISRNLPLGQKTGLMRPHLSVEMSHRGLASKQPMSKDPQKYGAYLASQQARKLQGGIRSTITPHMRHSQRSFISGQTGGGRLTNTLQYPRVPRPRLHQVRAPSIVPPKMTMPHLIRPKMPSMVTMSEDTPQHSDILKAGNAYQAALMRIALKEIRELMREKKDKDRKNKGYGNPDVAGAASSLPKYGANNPSAPTRPQGATEDENDSRLWGLAPGDIAGSGRI